MIPRETILAAVNVMREQTGAFRQGTHEIAKPLEALHFTVLSTAFVDLEYIGKTPKQDASSAERYRFEQRVRRGHEALGFLVDIEQSGGYAVACGLEPEWVSTLAKRLFIQHYPDGLTLRGDHEREEQEK